MEVIFALGFTTEFDKFSLVHESAAFHHQLHAVHEPSLDLGEPGHGHDLLGDRGHFGCGVLQQLQRTGLVLEVGIFLRRERVQFLYRVGVLVDLSKWKAEIDQHGHVGVLHLFLKFFEVGTIGKHAQLIPRSEVDFLILRELREHRCVVERESQPEHHSIHSELLSTRILEQLRSL